MSKRAGSLFGLSAEFEQAEQLLDAAKKAKEAGYNDIKAYSPFEVHGIDDVLGHNSNFLPWVVFIGMITGAVIAFSGMYWSSVIHYPLNVGGRPPFSWPAFIPITFEAIILGGALAAVGYFFVTTNLPLPYHPIFNADNAESISRDHFFLCITTADDKFDLSRTREFLQSLDPINVSEVAG